LVSQTTRAFAKQSNALMGWQKMKKLATSSMDKTIICASIADALVHELTFLLHAATTHHAVPP